MPSPSAKSEFAFTAMPMYKCHITFGLKINAMHIATCLLDTGDGEDLIFPLWYTQVGRHYKTENCGEVAFSNQAVNEFRRTHSPTTSYRWPLYTRVIWRLSKHRSEHSHKFTFIERLIRRILPTECTVVSKNSPRVEFLTHNQRKQMASNTRDVITLNQTMRISVTQRIYPVPIPHAK